VPATDGRSAADRRQPVDEPLRRDAYDRPRTTGRARPAAHDRPRMTDRETVDRRTRPQDPVATRLAAWEAARGATSSPEGRELASALAAGTVPVVYQPIIDLRHDVAIGVEALVRPGASGPVPDDEHAAGSVIDLAASEGLIDALGLAVLRTACRDLADWRRRPDRSGWQAHVNVSPLQLADPGFVPAVLQTLADTDVPPPALVLEVTESAALDPAGVTQLNLQALTSHGVEIALDDFGTAFSSLDLLAATPATTLKLDRSFVSSIGLAGTVRGRALVVRAAIELARTLGLRIVAEGIENGVQARTLRSWGCDLGQGYLFGPPSTAADVADHEPGRWRAPGTGTPLTTPSPSAIEIALAFGLLVALEETAERPVRAQAWQLGVAIARALEFERDLIDVTALLATIGDGAQRLPEAGTASPALEELRSLLSTPASVAADASPGAAAQAAWTLAKQRFGGSGPAGSRHPTVAREDASPDVAEAIRAWQARRTPVPSLSTDLRAFERRLRARDEVGHRLRSLLGMARAIGASGHLGDVLEVAAEEARRALGAASVAISRWDRSAGRVRTLVNVGQLAAWEERRPAAETYALPDRPQALERLHDHATHIAAVDDPHADPAEVALLRRLGKVSSAAQAIVVDGVAWGELYATTAPGEPRFSLADAPFLSAVTSFVGVAIARANDLAELERLAWEDPLTGIGNRRRFERHVSGLLAADDADVAVALIDVDGLQELNEAHGHATGDTVLSAIATALDRAAADHPGGLAARIGGDEFCLVLRGDEHDAQHALERVLAHLTDLATPRPRLSVGLAAAGAEDRSLRQLLTRADAAQYRAKRGGIPIATAERLPADRAQPAGHGSSAGRRAHRDTEPGSGRAAVEAFAAAVGRGAELGTALTGIGALATDILQLDRWVVTRLDERGHGTIAASTQDPVVRPPSGTGDPSGPGGIAARGSDLAGRPQVAAALGGGRGFVIRFSDPEADPVELDRLVTLGLRYVVGITARDDDGVAWLLELCGDDRSVAPEVATPVVEALASRALRREVSCAPPPPHDVREGWERP
jgi:diguanylate cyclase (GGDEF)-like protein